LKRMARSEFVRGRRHRAEVSPRSKREMVNFVAI
jgi:hypothetical protein